ncbi:MAG: MaoC family dehydratase, partial [Burkholderiales bacterium]|nr:MaoC family dehydratase [Burkholderiales bacterium]
QTQVGQEIGVSDWVTVDQKRLDLFAQATGDHQWIHVDPVRAARESPFGASVAHGFLTLSLLSKFLNESIGFPSARVGVNYGLNRVRFTAPVPVGARIRAHLHLRDVEDLDRGVQMTWDVTLELDGSDKPCLVAEWLTRRYE